jgi:hypothetical protein
MVLAKSSTLTSDSFHADYSIGGNMERNQVVRTAEYPDRGLGGTTRKMVPKRQEAARACDGEDMCTVRTLVRT